MLKMSNETYDKLKWVAQYGLPTVAFILGVLGKSLGVDEAYTAATVITALDAGLGGMLGVSTKDYYKLLNEIDASTSGNGQ